MGTLMWLAALLFLVLMEGSCCEGCWKHERDRLLDLKARFGNPDPLYFRELSDQNSSYLRTQEFLQIPEPFINWVDGTDYCQWEGVQCNSTTRRVVKLTLDYTFVSYRYLNLSDFLVFDDLKTLNLSGIYGCVGNGGLERRKFSNLEVLVLDLSSSNLEGTSFNMESCFSAISSLKSLELSCNWFTAESLQSLEILSNSEKFTSLKTLRLYRTGLDSEFNFSGLASNLINLEVLDLSGNNFDQAGDIFSSLRGLSSLKSLILRGCDLTSTSISSLPKLHSLEVLDLSVNYLNISFHTLSPQDNGRLPWPTRLEVLALGHNRFGNDILSSLSGLQHLKSLDLSYNNLEGSLDITGLHALSKLETLDLGGNDIDNFFVHQGTKFPCSLKVLFLDGMSIDANMLHKSLKAFPSITMLNLENCRFKGAVAAGDFVELSNLEHLVLDGSSSLRNEFFKSIGALTSLKVLSMTYCMINGILPAADWSNLEKLEELDMSSNEFEGHLPSSFGKMTSLKKLDLSYNRFTGNVGPNLAGLTSLEYLDFTENQFQVPASFSFFANHSHIKFIYGDGNNLILDPHPASRTWVPKFQLQELILSATTQSSFIPFPDFLLYQNKLTIVDFSGCKFGGEFPNWLLENNTEMTHLILGNNSFTGDVQFPSHRTPNIRGIDVSDNAITGQILGNNISSIFPKLHFLNMSRNAISGALPHEFGLMMSLITLDLSDNSLSGEIPANISAGSSLIGVLKLSNNKFSGQVSPLLTLPNLSYLYLDGNYFSGTLPSSFSNASILFYADLSNNYFVGKLPRLIGNSSGLKGFSMSNNHLEGSIPEELGGLEYLDLSRNNLSGSVPSFVNSTLSIIILSNNRLSRLATGMFSGRIADVLILDLSNNDINGTIQDMIGNFDEHNTELDILLLKGNQFGGQIPKKLCNIMGITILDFSHNSLSGPIPSCLGEIPFEPGPAGLTFFISGQEKDLPSNVQLQANFTTKRRAYKYDGYILSFMTGMDLSHNKLDGNIPPELGNLTEIRAINLSHNDITGHIPSTFSNLKQTESLDLSFNKLSGRIPPELTQLTSLEVFSVAHNNLSGATPDRKGQFITFDESSYEGNPFLCGPPLQTSCGDHIGHPSPHSPRAGGDTDSGFMDMEVFYISMAVSWTMVLLVMAAVLYINPYWRRAWFYFIELVIDTCYYFVIDHFPKLY